MSLIKLLPTAVVEQIAAGEVVDQPRAIVKELVENSLDAQATHITIELKAGGRELIRVSDDGIGIEEADLTQAVTPHATSKIRTLSDLTHLTSLGFRGEALAAVAASAELELISRPPQAAHGFRLTVSPVQQTDLPTPVGTAVGTTVTVAHLFEYQPARKKFLNTASTETQAITRWVSHVSLAFPEVSFRLIHNGNLLLRLPTAKTWSDRVQQVLGESVGRHLVELSLDEAHYKMYGAVGLPQLARSTSQHQFLLINRRPVDHKALASAFKKGYAHLISKASYPIGVIYLELPPALIDHNIHPQKKTVAITQEKEVTSLVTSHVRSSLQQQRPLQYQLPPAPEYRIADIHQDQTADYVFQDHLKQLVDSWTITGNDTVEPEILQVHKTFLVLASPLTDGGVMVIDQHAAHERILFEQYLSAFTTNTNSSSVTKVTLEHPLLVTCSALELTHIMAATETLSQLGFHFELFGTQAIRVTHIPSGMGLNKVEQTLREVADDLAEEHDLPHLTTSQEKTIAYTACRTAIQAGDYLTPAQRQELIIKLATTTHNQTCPHGRPITLYWSRGRLNKLFERT